MPNKFCPVAFNLTNPYPHITAANTKPQHDCPATKTTMIVYMMYHLLPLKCLLFPHGLYFKSLQKLFANIQDLALEVACVKVECWH